MEDVDKSPNRVRQQYIFPTENLIILSQGGFLNLSWNLRRQHEYVKEQPSTAGKNAKVLKTPSLESNLRKLSMSTFTPMEKLGTFVRADKSQAKGTKFLFVYNKIEPTESLKV